MVTEWHGRRSQLPAQSLSRKERSGTSEAGRWMTQSGPDAALRKVPTLSAPIKTLRRSCCSVVGSASDGTPSVDIKLFGSEDPINMLKMFVVLVRCPGKHLDFRKVIMGLYMNYLFHFIVELGQKSAWESMSWEES